MIFLAFLLGTGEAGEILSVNGDIKSFFLLTDPVEHIFFPEGAYGQGFLDGRIKLRADFTDSVRVEFHHAVTAGTAVPKTQLEADLIELGIDISDMEGSSFGMSQTGVGLTAPEVIELSWTGFEDDDNISLQGRTDRALIKVSLGSTDLSLGRQAISFGHGMFFNPMDLVQPFSIATIDAEYKPGIDAIRIDQYFGMASQITGVVAYAGASAVEWEKEGLVGVLNGNTTIGWTDVSLFLGLVRGDVVVGTGLATSVGPVGINGDITYTIPEDSDEDHFIRTELGAMWRPFEDSTVTGEVYYQSLGKTDTADYLEFASSDRFARRELWLMGQTYGSLSWMQQITSMTSGSLASIVNINDSSFMLMPSLSISVSDEVSLVAGGYMGIGEEPKATSATELILLGIEPKLNSEFGLMGSTGFVQMKAYF